MKDNILIFRKRIVRLTIQIIAIAVLFMVTNCGVNKKDRVKSMTYYIEKIRPDFKIGTYFYEDPTDKTVPNLNFIKSNFNAVTIGVYMKKTQKEGKDSWFLEGVDKRVQFAMENNMKIKFHPGIGGNTYNPDWLVNGGYSAGQLREILEERFKILLERHKGKVKAFELVNESTSSSRFDDLGGENVWSKSKNVWMKLGWKESKEGKWPSYIEEAFIIGEKYAGDEVELILNENNNSMEESTKTDNFYQSVKILLAGSIPIDGVGLQMHCSIVNGVVKESGFGTGANLDIISLKKTLEKYGKLGVDVHITEFDVHLPENPSENDFALQAKAYRDVLKAALESPYCKSFTTWGTADPHGWKPFEYTQHPLWLDYNYKPKKAYFEVLKMLKEMAGENTD